LNFFVQNIYKFWSQNGSDKNAPSKNV